MEFNWKLFISALGLACIIEGVPYFLFAEKMPRILREITEKGPGMLRSLGISAILFGIFLIYLARG